MNQSPISKQLLLGSIIFSLVVLLLLFIRSFFETRTKLVFCDVGQGDGMYLRIRNRFDIIIDAGPGDSILTCLGKHMPFYDRTVELAILTNSDLDHFAGFMPISERYTIKLFFMPPHSKDSTTFKRLIQAIKKKKTYVYFPKAPESFTLYTSTIDYYWPTKEFLEAAVSFPSLIEKETPFDVKLGSTTYDENEFSAMFLFQQGDFRVLFTGDATPSVLEKVSKHIPFSNVREIDILKVPHHGSKNGLTPDFLKLADPMISVISVGKNNKYGHPSPEILALFKALKKKYVRTDQEGDIVYWIK